MSVLGKRKEGRLYVPNWQCPVCLDEFGIDKGVVPCALTRCRPVAHMLCFDCAKESRDAKTNLIECPLCRSKDNEALPLAEMVDESADPDAKERLDTLRYKKAASEGFSAVIENSRLAASKLGNVEAKLMQNRVQHIVEVVSLKINNGSFARNQNSMICWSFTVPDFDKNIVQIHPRRTSVFQKKTVDEVITKLDAMARKLHIHLEAIYKDSPYKVMICNKQYIHKKGVRGTPLKAKTPVYLKVKVGMRNL